MQIIFVITELSNIATAAIKKINEDSAPKLLIK